MGMFDFLKPRSATAAIAKDRLQIIVARERRVGVGASYLPQLQQELLAVVAKYEKLDLDLVTVNVEQRDDGEVLELNVVLPEERPAPPPPTTRKKKRRKKKRGRHLAAAANLATS